MDTQKLRGLLDGSCSSIEALGSERGAPPPRLTAIPYPVLWTAGLFDPLLRELRASRPVGWHGGATPGAVGVLRISVVWYRGASTMLRASPNSAAPLADAVWIDLVDPTDDERQRVEEATKLRLPTRAEIAEIESSSRVFTEGEASYLSTPVIESNDCLNGSVTAVAFVLSTKHLVSLRFGEVAAFDTVAKTYSGVEAASPPDVFLRLLEAIVEHTADALEHGSAELESISHAAFRAEQPKRKKLAKASERLRAALRKLGRMGDGISHIRDTLLGLSRIALFVRDNTHQNHPVTDHARLEAIRTDIGSLNDYQAHLFTKVQFLLDATLGFINIEQNDIVKTLTIVSVVGVPPVLIAGIYGMNFKHMPELDWSLGYPGALVLIVVSALLPVAWFKWRGWM